MNNLEYNSNGALSYDANKGVSWINYDQWGNPIRVQFTDHSITEHVYTAGIEETLSPLPLKEGGLFNLNGQRINTLQKGLNIVDGKKVWVK